MANSFRRYLQVMPFTPAATAAHKLSRTRKELMPNPTDPPRLHRLRKRIRRLALPSSVLLAALPVYAQGTGDPWDNAVTVLKVAFTGTIANALSLVAIVVGGLMFAYGEGQSKKTVAGIVFGVGMAVGAVNFMAWLFP